MKLLKIQRTDAFVRFSHETTGPTIKANDPKNPGKVIEKVSNEARVVTAHETPLKSFDDAFQALGDVVANILETGADWAEGVTILSLSLSYTKAGIRTAVISFSKKLDAIEGAAHQLDTPGFQIDDGQTPDEGRKQCSKKHAEMVAKVIHEAERYAEGERQQTMLKFEKGSSDSKAEPEEGDVLDFKGGQPDAPDADAPPASAAPASTKSRKPRGAVQKPARSPRS